MPSSSPVHVPQYETQFQPLPDDDQTLWEAIEILKERKHRYLVRWDGIDPQTQKAWEPSWVPKHDCTNELIYDWKLAKAKKAQARKKRQQSNDDLSYNPANASKKSSKSRSTRSKSRSAAATSHKPSSGPEPSTLGISPSSNKSTPVVEITRLKKRPRESRRSEINLTDEDDGAVAPVKKKRKLSTPPPEEKYEQEEQEGHEWQSQEVGDDSYEVKPRNGVRKRHVVISQGSDAGGGILMDHDDPVERKSRDDDPGRFQSSLRGLDYHIPSDDVPMEMEEPLVLKPHSDHNSSPLLSTRELTSSPLLPSPRELIRSPVKHRDSVVPESQSSNTSSRSALEIPQAPASVSPKHKQDHTPTPPPKSHAFRELRPVRTISPTIFRTYHPPSNSRHNRHAQPNSQVSEIGSFTSPNKSVQQQRREKLVAYSQRQEEEESESDAGRPGYEIHDPLDNDNEIGQDTLDAALRQNGEQLAEAERQRASSRMLPKAVKRPLREVLSNQSVSHPQSDDKDSSDAEPVDNTHQRASREPSAGTTKAYTKTSAKGVIHFLSKPLHAFLQRHSVSSSNGDGEVESVSTSQPIDNEQLPPEQDEEESHISLSSSSYPDHVPNDADNLADEKDADIDELIDELRPEDAPDAEKVNVTSQPSGVIDSLSTPAKANFSLDATGPWTQNSSHEQLTTIKSPIRQLDKALGLLHRKSEEIHELERDRKEFQVQIKSLQSKLAVAEMRYGQVSARLDTERMQRDAEKEKQKEEREAAPADEERLAELLQENGRLRAVNQTLESDKELLRDLYGRASDAHRVVMAENSVLVRDNQSLREQATTGVMQAGVLWKTKVHTLETELARVRGTAGILADQARRTDDEVRRRAALLPMAQKDTLDALDEVERMKDKIRELGRENTSLRIEVKEWVDDAMTRRRMQIEAERRDEESQEELVWVCHWIDAERRTKCAALLESREKLREHVYEAGHI